MDETSIVALATALATALAAHLKNRDQDRVVDGLKKDMAALHSEIDDCHKERQQLRQLIEDHMNG